MFKPDSIYEKLVEAGTEWSKANARADGLEECKKVVLSELMDKSDEKSTAAKEAFAYRHPDYRKHLDDMVMARKEANIAKVEYAARQAWCDMMRTQAANERAANRSAT